MDSYDVFETCLVRKVADPHQVHDRVSERCGLGPAFRKTRIEAEIEANRRMGGDAPLNEIYRVLEDWMAWSTARREEVMAAELAEEREQLRPVPAIHRRVQESRRRDGRVAFLSDMYLPAEFVGERLKAHGFLGPEDLLLVSGEEGVSKHGGGMFGRAAERAARPLSTHTGNSQRADVNAARRAGLQARWFPEGNLSRYEQRMMAWAGGSDRRTGDWAGAARVARLKAGPEGGDEPAFARVSAGVAGPLVMLFSAWLVEQARREGLDRLYFLARDGQCLMEPFRLIAEARGLDLEVRYLYASRIALRFPRSFPMSDEDLDGVLQHSHPEIPAEVVAARLGVAPSRLREWLPAKAFGRHGLRRSMRDSIASALANEPARSYLQATAKDREELLLAYLEQEGVAGAGRVGLVDLGWGGTLQAGLVRTLERTGREAGILGLYLALNRLPQAPTLEARAMLFHPDTRGRIAGGPWLSTLAECFCQADSGTTLGFRRGNQGQVEAVLDEPDGSHPRVPDWLQLHREVLREFVEEVINNDALPEVPSAYGRMITELLKDCWLRPDVDEARAWGDIQFATHGLSSTRVALAAPPVTPVDLLWTLGSGALGYGKTVWRQGAAARLPGPLARLALALHRLRGRRGS